MAKKPVYKTYRGTLIDMDGLRAKHEGEVALGNMGVNAKGDKLGPGGDVVKSSQQRVKRFYNKSSQVKNISIKEDIKEEKSANVFPEEAPKVKGKQTVKKKTKKVEKENDNGDITIEEVDED